MDLSAKITAAVQLIEALPVSLQISFCFFFQIALTVQEFDLSSTHANKTKYLTGYLRSVSKAKDAHNVTKIASKST